MKESNKREKYTPSTVGMRRSKDSKYKQFQRHVQRIFHGTEYESQLSSTHTPPIPYQILHVNRPIEMFLYFVNILCQ